VSLGGAHRSTPVGEGLISLPSRQDARSVETGSDAALRAVGTVQASRATEVAIRLLDVVGATLLLILLAPMLVLVAVIVRLDSPGAAIYRQRRVGRNLKPFSVTKFRTMGVGASTDRHRQHVEQMLAEDKRGTRPMTKLQEDTRITRAGAFLRRTSIDELPQLWNVLLGDMSLVGPRPPIQYEVDRYPERAFRRFAVRPGMTGLWQVSGRSLLSFPQMIELDAEYVERRSLFLNLKILALTLPTVVHGKGAR
jgi:lipopolysaccharide/colanic/teichoic acid biosynthesis glycosyltransferase